MEAVGPLLALQTWPELTDGLWVHFVDNEGARNTLIRGSSSVQSLNSLALETWRQAKDRRLYLWAERVDTKDNPIDAMSRHDGRDLWDQHWAYRKPVGIRKDVLLAHMR